MHICTIVGTRPEIIRLSLIMKKLDELCTHTVIHTGQNYDKNLNDIFYSDLNLRSPDYIIDSKSESPGKQISIILSEVETILKNIKPDKVLILGDTNSGLSSIIAEKLGIPVYHMEAGNRCYDSNVPEEKNRKIIDITSSYNLPYTENSRQNLLSLGIHKSKIFLTGNPITEVIQHFMPKQEVVIHHMLNLGYDIYSPMVLPFILVTAHRAESVDNIDSLKSIIEALKIISKNFKVIFSCHPRTKHKLSTFKINTDGICIIDPVDFTTFLSYEMCCTAIITDSGTVCEEGNILNKPCIIIRDSTERPEVLEAGGAILSGTKTESIIRAFNSLVYDDYKSKCVYNDYNVSNRVVNFLLGEQKNVY